MATSAPSGTAWADDSTSATSSTDSAPSDASPSTPKGGGRDAVGADDTIDDGGTADPAGDGSDPDGDAQDPDDKLEQGADSETTESSGSAALGVDSKPGGVSDRVSVEADGKRDASITERVTTRLAAAERSDADTETAEESPRIARPVDVETATAVAVNPTAAVPIAWSGSAKSVDSISVPAPMPAPVVAAGSVIAASVDRIVSFFEPIFGPGGQFESPLMLGLLGWIRRQTYQAFANRSPEIGRDVISVTVTGDSAGQAIADLPTHDADGDLVTYTAHGAVHGSVVVVGHRVTYVPNPGFVGADSFTLVASDAGNGNHIHAVGHTHIDVATVNVTVLDPNNAPVITWLAADPAIDHRNRWHVRVTAADADGDTWTTAVSAAHAQITETQPGRFIVTLDEQWAQRNPGAAVSVAVTVTDEHGATTVRDVVVIGTVNNAVVIGDLSLYRGSQIPSLPAGVTYVAVSAGQAHTVLLRSDGKVVASVQGPSGVTSLPYSNAVHTKVEAGHGQTFLLTTDGRVIGGGVDLTPTPVSIPSLPAGLTYVDVAVNASWYGVVLRSDGAVFRVGNPGGQLVVPPSPQGVTNVAVFAGHAHTLMLRSDGSMVGVGDNTYGQLAIPDLPPGVTYTAAAGGTGHTVLLRSDGTVVGVGDNTYGQIDIPDLPTGVTYTGVSAAVGHTVLLRSDGTAVGLGRDSGLGETVIPELPDGLIYTQADIGHNHTVLLTARA
ncbi:Ig-like domain-containing protein [Mycobacterium sp. C31M]